MGPNIVYEDEHIVICNKPPGVASQSERGLEPDLLSLVRNEYLRKGQKSELHIINRLDKPVGGLVLFARDKKTASLLSALSGEHSIEKEYVALVSGHPKQSGEYKDYLIKDGRINLSGVTEEGTPGAKYARLMYSVIGTKIIEGKEYSLVRIRLFTGRHHQIRVQFSHHGHPLYGDVKYNPEFKNRHDVTPALFAARLSFNNPYGAEKITVEAEPMGNIWK